MTYADKVVWITGAGSGIGRAMALQFASQGAAIAASGRRRDRLDALVEEVQGMGRRALAVPCDVTDDQTLKDAVATIVAELGRLDVAVANAGFAVGGRVANITADEWRRQLDVNVVGAAMTAHHALPELHKTGGRMAFVSSVAGQLAAPGYAAYNASKYAVRAIGQTLAAELAGTGVSATTLYPGFVESEIAQVDNAGAFDGTRPDKRPKNLMWPTDKAARVMVGAITARKREYVFTWHGVFGAWMGRHMPGFAHWAMSRGPARKNAAILSESKKTAS